MNFGKLQTPVYTYSSLNLTSVDYTQTTVGGSLVHKVITYMTLGGFKTFSGLPLVVRFSVPHVFLQ